MNQLGITPPQRIIGLTGGVGMGKSTVSRHLAAQHHLPVLDADLYAREAVQLGSPILAAIAARYGDHLLLPDGTLDRRQLGAIVFQQPEERRWLESQIHPYVRDRFRQAQAELADAPIIVNVIPLLFEANLTATVTEIWVVACAEATQLERLVRRDQLSTEQAQARIASQCPIATKIAQADVVLRNDGTVAALLRQTDAALAKPPRSPHQAVGNPPDPHED